MGGGSGSRSSSFHHLQKSVGPDNFRANLEENMFHLLWEAIIGLIVGALAKLVMPGRQPGGVLITMLIGIAGSIIATFIGSHLGWYQEGQRAGFLMSFLGAVLLLFIYRL